MPSEAAWLPNAAVAKAWMEYVKTGATTDTTAPPVPFDVRVSKGDPGIEVNYGVYYAPFHVCRLGFVEGGFRHKTSA